MDFYGDWAGGSHSFKFITYECVFSLLFLTLMVNHVLVLLGRDDVPTLYFVLVFYSSLEEINVFAYLRSIMGMTESIWTG